MLDAEKLKILEITITGDLKKKKKKVVIFFSFVPRWRDQALSLWSGSTDSKTLDYQRTNSRKYQIVRTHTKETTWIQDLASHPNTSSTLCRTPHLNNKQNKNTNPIINRQDYHLTQPCQSEEKPTNKNSEQISPYTELTQTTGPTLGGQKPKGRKNFTFFKEKLQLSLKPANADLKHNNLEK